MHEKQCLIPILSVISFIFDILRRITTLVKKRFRSGVNIHRTRSFPGADIGSDHELVMMTFRVRLKKARKPNQQRLRFDLEKLRDPDVACTFQATIGG